MQGQRAERLVLCGRVDPLCLDNTTGVPSLTLKARSVLKAWTSPLQYLSYKYQGVEQRGTHLCSSTLSKLHKMRKDSQKVKPGEPISERIDAGGREGDRGAFEPGYRCSSLIIFAGCLWLLV